MKFHQGTLPEFRGCWILDIGEKFNLIFHIISGIGGIDIKLSPIFLPPLVKYKFAPAV